MYISGAVYAIYKFLLICGRVLATRRSRADRFSRCMSNTLEQQQPVDYGSTYPHRLLDCNHISIKLIL
jgi:hypothetical protein